MFTREVRFYREVAPYVGVRTPACYLAEEQAGATHLELEDLSAWQPGASPDVAARLLRDLHARWEGRAVERWPWLPRPDLGDLVGAMYDEAWASARERPELTSAVRDLGDSLVGRVAEVDERAEASGPADLHPRRCVGPQHAHLPRRRGRPARLGGLRRRPGDRRPGLAPRVLGPPPARASAPRGPRDDLRPPRRRML